MSKVKKGDEVTWKSHGGTAHGEVKKTITSDTTIKGNTIRASKDEPKIVVATNKGAKAAHNPEALKKA